MFYLKLCSRLIFMLNSCSSDICLKTFHSFKIKWKQIELKNRHGLHFVTTLTFRYEGPIQDGGRKSVNSLSPGCRRRRLYIPWSLFKGLPLLLLAQMILLYPQQQIKMAMGMSFYKNPGKQKIYLFWKLCVLVFCIHLNTHFMRSAVYKGYNYNNYE